MRGASEQIMQIHVGGTLQNPLVQKEAFPGVNQALQELQNEIQGGPNPPVRYPPTRQRTPNTAGGTGKYR
ncbi:MAG: hypothetical protein A2V70_00605 [Planctomycetes bacterium RBG_13_63_9]|nr:MAG: hypothetical protein A2V70_00605 [Planctomycetes bacterium RBG_13_63_9]